MSYKINNLVLKPIKDKDTLTVTSKLEIENSIILLLKNMKLVIVMVLI